MDVSTASSSSTVAAHHHMRRAHRRSQSDSSQSTDSSSESTQAQGNQPGGDGQDPASALDQILKNGGGVADVKAQLQKNFEAFQSSDKFKSLPADVQQKIEQRDSGDNLDKLAQRMVDNYQKNGTVKPPEHPDGGAERAQWMAKLEEQGRSQQAGVYAKFGVGGFAPTAATPAADSTDASAADAESIAGA